MNKKIKSYNFGIWAEYFAIMFLALKGYRLLERRYKTKLGEIDVIAKRGKQIVFVEVKARSLKSESEVLTQHQIHRINRAALLFIAKNSKFADYFLRFDLIIIRPFKIPEHIENAWQT